MIKKLEGTIKLKKGQVLVEQGQENGSYYKLVSGKLGIYVRNKFKKNVLRDVVTPGPFSIVCEFSYFENIKVTASVVALEDSVVEAVSNDTFKKEKDFLKKYAPNTYILMLHMIEKFQVISKKAVPEQKDRSDKTTKSSIKLNKTEIKETKTLNMNLIKNKRLDKKVTETVTMDQIKVQNSDRKQVASKKKSTQDQKLYNANKNLKMEQDLSDHKIDLSELSEELMIERFSEKKSE